MSEIVDKKAISENTRVVSRYYCPKWRFFGFLHVVVFSDQSSDIVGRYVQ